MEKKPEELEDRLKCKKVLSKTLQRHFPVLQWLPKYSSADAFSDFIAGLTLGLTIVPQSIAYASLAGVTSEIGLNSAFAGALLYVFFGTVKQVIIGPTALVSLLTHEYTKEIPVEHLPQYVFLLTFVSGCVELILSVFRLGFIVDIISDPVISGFTSASAIIIITSQMKDVLGITLPKTENMRDNVVKLIQYCHNIRWPDTILGVSCVIVLLVLKSLSRVPLNKSVPGRKILSKFLWFVSVSRNATVVLVMCIISYRLESNGHTTFLLTKHVTPGLPAMQPPSFGMVQGNSTVTFTEMLDQLKSGIIVVPIISILINVSIAKAYAMNSGEIDTAQEMLALSACNIVASFLKSLPVCGAFTRSAVSNTSGVKTPFANFYSALITVLALTYLATYFHYIPRATVAAVVIAAVVFLIDFKILKPLWRSCKRDFFTTLLTIFVCLCFGIQTGLLAGVLSNVIYLIYLWARPSVAVEKYKNEYGEYVVVTPDLGLFYPAVGHLRSILSKTVLENDQKLPIAVNCCYFKGIDFSVLKVLSSMAEDFNKRGQRLVFFNATAKILESYKKSGYKSLQFCTLDGNLNDMLFGDTINDSLSKVTARSIPNAKYQSK